MIAFFGDIDEEASHQRSIAPPGRGTRSSAGHDHTIAAEVPMGEATSESARVGSAVRIAAVGDLHCTKANAAELGKWLPLVNRHADVFLLCGDLTDYGLVEETRALAKELAAVHVPILAVLGNHDHESGDPETVVQILSDAGVHVLRGESIEIAGVGFAGAKGFMGGFGSATLGHWGESATKKFVEESVDESLKLETALARLRTDRRVVILHYSPIRATVEGEPPEIFAFLGCGRLEEPLLRYPVDAVFHGHAHRGQLEGRTSAGTPVYNVAMPLLRRKFPESVPFRVVELGGELSDELGGELAVAEARH